MVITMNLEQAAEFLHMNIESVRRLAQNGTLPAAKPGKRWVFIEEDLAVWLRSLYSQSRRALLSGTTTGGKLCHSRNVDNSGTFHSRHQAVSELESLLEQQ